MQIVKETTEPTQAEKEVPEHLLRIAVGAKVTLEGIPFEVAQVRRSGIVIRPERSVIFTSANDVMLLDRKARRKII